MARTAPDARGRSLWNWLRFVLRRAGWAPAVLMVFYGAATLGIDAFTLYPTLDNPAHVAGGVALSYFFVVAFDSAENFVGAVARPLRPVLVLACVSLAAVCWEFYEYLSDYWLATSMQLGVRDTMSDLFLGLLGGAAYLAARWASGVFRRLRRRARAAKRKAG